MLRVFARECTRELTGLELVAAMTRAKLGVRSSGRKGREILVMFWDCGKAGQKFGLMAVRVAPQVRRVSARREAMCPPPTMSIFFSSKSIIIGKNGGLVINAFLSAVMYMYIFTWSA